ncbi:MAG: NAD-dependent epimerase/dehydratase family protein, partial [Verrucomicrobiota bacterium]|nr:NAD-dependent epimerase/dehydratase family protein [Verrucomicrobiota bacterium]
MKIVVTGGMGFIGSSVLTRLLALEHKIVAIGRSANPRNARSHPN